jgi:hypothetical protein
MFSRYLNLLQNLQVLHGEVRQRRVVVVLRLNGISELKQKKVMLYFREKLLSTELTTVKMSTSKLPTSMYPY